jgi:hypothetical protein
MADELAEVRRLRLKLKAAKALIRDLGIAVAQCEDALEAAHRNPQPREAQDHEHHHSLTAA